MFLHKVSQLRCLFLGQCPCMLSLLSFRMMVSSSTANSRFFSALCVRRNALFSIYSAAFFGSSGSLSKRCECQNESFSLPKKIVQHHPVTTVFHSFGKVFLGPPFLGRSLLQNFSFEGPLPDHSLKFHRQTFTRENFWGRLAEINGPLKKAEPTWKCFFC